MLIYDQTFSEVFKKIPFQYQAVIVAGTSFIAFIILYMFYMLFSLVIGAGKPVYVGIENMPENITNMTDPSIAVYKSDIKSKKSVIAVASQAGDTTNIRLLTSSDPSCRKWSYNDYGMEGKNDTLIAPDGVSDFRSGSWRVETPAIVYDPDDKGKEWKLFAFKYFWSPKDDIESAIKIAKYYGVITYKYTSDISSRNKWSDEIWLFSPEDKYPPLPYNGLVKQHINGLSADLSDVTSYSRPSVIYKDKILLMSLSAFTDKNTPNRTILLASVDHGQTWTYLGSPLGENDIKTSPSLGSYYKGASLIAQDNSIYLAAVFGDEKMNDTGTKMFLITDTGHAQIERTSKGAPIISAQYGHFSRNSNTLSGGFMTYSDDCSKFGMIVSEQSEKTGIFRLVGTFKQPTKQ